MIINRTNLQTLEVSFNASFKRGFDGVKGIWSRIASEIPSATASNLYPFLGDSQSMRRWVGDRVVQNLKQYAYTLENLDFELTESVDRNHIQDDQYGVYSLKFQSMGDSAARHPDELVFSELLLGTSQVCYDGQFFFDTDHPVFGTTASNYDATGGGALWYLMDTTRPLKPMIFQKRQDYQFQSFDSMDDEFVFRNKKFLYGVDSRVAAGYGMWQMAYASANTLSAANCDTYVEAMMALTSEQGKKLGISPNVLLVGPSRMSEARDLVTKQYLASGESNPYFNRFEVIVSPYLT